MNKTNSGTQEAERATHRGQPNVSLPPNMDATPQPRGPDLTDCAPIANSVDVLEQFASAVRSNGVVGEERLAKLLYLALTSRLLSRPVSVAVKGPSSGGKSYTVGNVLQFFPASAFVVLSAMSEKALVYSDEPLQHRFLVLHEAAGIQGDFTEYLIRSLLSEGHLRYETVERAADGSFVPRLIEREGPTGLIVTTTLASMNPENETRYLSITVADTPEQTRHILRAMASGTETKSADQTPWVLFQRWLEGGTRDVAIPFAEALVDLIPPVAVRLRRDVAKLLTLIRAHTLIHQATRKRDAQGRIVAELADYLAVYELVDDLIAAGVEATVPETIRETVNAVAKLVKSAPHSEGASKAAVAASLALDKSAAWRRVRDAMQRGYLENLETGKGRRAKLVLGDTPFRRTGPSCLRWRKCPPPGRVAGLHSLQRVRPVTGKARMSMRLLSPEAEAELFKLIDERVAQQLCTASSKASESSWLTVAEGAEYARTTPSALYKRIERGQLRGHRPEGSKILLRRADLVGAGPATSADL